MDDERYLPGMPALDRQPVRETRSERALPPSLRGLPPRWVPETQPTPLRDHYISLSVVAFLCGALAITAVEFGSPIGSPLVKLCVIVGTPPLALAMGDAALRIWRSAWAWMPVNAGRGSFRLAWVGAIAILFAALATADWLVLSA